MATERTQKDDQTDFLFALGLTAHPSMNTDTDCAPSAGGASVESVVRITLNGEERELSGPLTIAELVGWLGLKTEHVAVELNKGLVTRAEHSLTKIADGDVVEVVTLVGGGKRPRTTG